MNRRVTGGLAWAGLLLVLAVPSADLISQQFSPDRALTIDPVATPASKPASSAASKPVAEKPKADVAVVVPTTKKGKPMPSYISDGAKDETVKDVAVVKPQTPATPRVIPGPTPAPLLPEPKVVISAPASKTPVSVPAPAQVASVEINPAIAPPIPMPASMRPSLRPQQQQPQAVDQVNTGAITTVNQSGYSNDDVVTSDELADWESGPLEEFLANRRAPRSVQAQSQPSDFDDNGFFLSDGPNASNTDERVFPFAYN